MPPAPGDLVEGVEAARPVLRPLWRRVRNSRSETHEVSDGDGRLMERKASWNGWTMDTLDVLTPVR